MRAYKVHRQPIEALAGITLRPIGDLQPSHFYFVSQRGRASSRLKPFPTKQIPTLKDRGRDRSLIGRKQRFSVNVWWIQNSEPLLRLNKLAAVGSVENKMAAEPPPQSVSKAWWNATSSVPVWTETFSLAKMPNSVLLWFISSIHFIHYFENLFYLLIALNSPRAKFPSALA